MAVKLPEQFINQMQSLLGEKADLFFASLDKIVPISIRQNPYKYTEIQHLIPVSSVNWEPFGSYLQKRPRFANDPLFHAGSYYVQEASSMFLGFIIRQLSNTDKWKLVIDLCAAPGGKSTHILSFLQEDTILLSNELISSRLGALRQNLLRWGRLNALTTSMEVAAMAATGIQADLVLVDAPCSGEGLFRKDPESIHHWSPDQVRSCALRQHQILISAQKLVAEGGYLIYSTCTYNWQENIENLASIDKELFEPVILDIPSTWNVQQIEKNGDIGYQFYPHLIQGEGFFISVFRKKLNKEGSCSNDQKQNWELLPDKNIPNELKNKFLGKNIIVKQENVLYAMPENWKSIARLKLKPLFELGHLVRSDFIPTHGLAMLADQISFYPNIELNLAQAIDYLKRMNFSLEKHYEKGFYFCTYQGVRLGLIKVMPGRINNYYPNEWRILK